MGRREGGKMGKGEEKERKGKEFTVIGQNINCGI
jgi:hypothetical protein